MDGRIGAAIYHDTASKIGVKKKTYFLLNEVKHDII
jgi:hypothetical protein